MQLKKCNRCGSESYSGQWKFGRWFCETCLEYNNVSEADESGTKLEDWTR